MAVVALNVKPVDAWVCRIPRPVLQGLAMNAGFHNRERVFFALLAELYSHRIGGQGHISLPRLQRLTGIHKTSIRRALEELQGADIVQADSQPGRTRLWRLAGCAAYVHPAQQGGTPGAHMGDTQGGTDGVHPYLKKTEGKLLKKGKNGFGRYDRQDAEKYVFVGGEPLGVGEPMFPRTRSLRGRLSGSDARAAAARLRELGQ